MCERRISAVSRRSRPLELKHIDFDLREVIDGSIDAVSLKANEKGLELIIDVDSGIPAWMRGDPTRLRQILLNLISNAFKFTDVGEESLTVSATPATAADRPMALSFTKPLDANRLPIVLTAVMRAAPGSHCDHSQQFPGLNPPQAARTPIPFHGCSSGL